MTEETPAKPKPRGIWPPQALLLGLLLQGVAILWRWPISPPTWAMGLGVVLFLMGVGLNFSAAMEFRRKKVGIVPFTPSEMLALGGPYRFTRNPMYIGMSLILAALAVGTGLWFDLLIPLVFLVWVHNAYVLPEEAFLEARYGADYDTYRRRIPRWIGLGGR
jgi:protein-S-isoprenylcysteine O-methyltransferase Ste14